MFWLQHRAWTADLLNYRLVIAETQDLNEGRGQIMAIETFQGLNYQDSDSDLLWTRRTKGKSRVWPLG